MHCTKFPLTLKKVRIQSRNLTVMITTVIFWDPSEAKCTFSWGYKISRDLKAIGTSNLLLRIPSAFDYPTWCAVTQLEENTQLCFFYWKFQFKIEERIRVHKFAMVICMIFAKNKNYIIGNRIWLSIFPFLGIIQFSRLRKCLKGTLLFYCKTNSNQTLFLEFWPCFRKFPTKIDNEKCELIRFTFHET